MPIAARSGDRSVAFAGRLRWPHRARRGGRGSGAAPSDHHPGRLEGSCSRVRPARSAL